MPESSIDPNSGNAPRNAVPVVVPPEPPGTTMTWDGVANLPALPGYEILEELGSGGMGVVYKARRRTTGDVVALKVIRRERLSHPAAVRRFRREAQAASRLAHANVVVVHEANQEGDTHYLAMEFVDGFTLQRMVERWGCLPVGLACDVVRQVALGLQHAQEQALVHRDIKPANLMVSRTGLAQLLSSEVEEKQPIFECFQGVVVKVLDMGVARLNQLSDNQEELLTTLTEEGAMLGTPDFIAPEQLEDARKADIRADLYSLGCTFHFLLAGQVPFPGGTLLHKLDRQRWAMPTPVDQLRPEVPAAIAAVVRRLTAKRPEDRYQTPTDLIIALDHLSRTGQLPAEPAPPMLQPRLRLEGHAAGVSCVALAPDGRLAVSGSQDGVTKLWDLDTGQFVRDFLGPRQPLACLAWLPDGRQVIGASGASLYCWEVSSGREVGRLMGHTGIIRTLAINATGRWALSAGEDRNLRLWDLTTRREVKRLSGHGRDVTAVAFNLDGTRALSGSRDQTLRLWDLQRGEPVRAFAGKEGLVLAATLSLDGRRALSGHFDTTIRLWDVELGKELRRFQGHRQMVTAVAFHPDGRRLLSAAQDRTVRVWDRDSASELLRLEGATAGVTSLAVTAEGGLVLAGSSDHTVYAWRLPT